VSGSEREEGFLSRWARRKAEASRARAGVRERSAEEAAEAGRAPRAMQETGVPAAAARAEGEPIDDDREPEDPGAELQRLGLPDPDTLGPEANFRMFFAEGVPSWLKRRAMRRLFRVNPIIRTVDMMDDYARDYTDAATVTALAKSAGEAARRLRERLVQGARDGRREHGDAIVAQAEDGRGEAGAAPEPDVEGRKAAGETRHERTQDAGKDGEGV